MRGRVLVLGLLATPGCGLDLGGLSGQADAASTADEGDGETVVETSTEGSSTIASSADGGHGAAEASPQLDAGSRADTNANPRDAASDASEGGGTCASVPSGWILAIYDLGQDACPPGFPPHEVSGQTTIGAGACSCTCAVTQTGSCTDGDLTVTYAPAGSNACTMLSFMATFNGPSCTALGSSLSVSGSPSNLATPLAPQGGTCADMVRTDPSQLSAVKTRYCDVPAGSMGAVCGGTVPSGFAACIVTDGETDCPLGTPFGQKYTVEDLAVTQCSPCSSACTVTTTCSNATVSAYSDMACKNLVGSVPVNGTCTPVMFFAPLPSTLVAVEYAATASSTCSAGSSTPSVRLMNPRTVCCR
jgi:hypothetical protein